MGRIVFSNSSTNSIIDYAQITSNPDTIIYIYSAAVTTIRASTIRGTTGNATYIYNSSPNVAGNIISDNGNGISIHGNSSPRISANTISNNTGNGIETFTGSPITTGNNIKYNRCGISEAIVSYLDSTSISDSTLSGNYYGIYLSFFVLYDTPQIVTGNLITGSHDAITIEAMFNWVGHAEITSNTVADNTSGVVVPGHILENSRFNQNNIYGNSGYNVKVDSSYVDATNNWWGTKDTQAINQTIIGTASFVSFLNAPNPQAPAYILKPTPLPSPSPTPIATPDIPEFPWIIILILIVAATLAITVEYKRRAKDGLIHVKT